MQQPKARTEGNGPRRHAWPGKRIRRLGFLKDWTNKQGPDVHAFRNDRPWPRFLSGRDSAPPLSRLGDSGGVALWVEDIDRTAEDLRQHGVPFETETTPGGALRQLYVTDPNGVRIELNAPG